MGTRKARLPPSGSCLSADAPTQLRHVLFFSFMPLPTYHEKGMCPHPFNLLPDDPSLHLATPTFETQGRQPRRITTILVAIVNQPPASCLEFHDDFYTWLIVIDSETLYCLHAVCKYCLLPYSLLSLVFQTPQNLSVVWDKDARSPGFCPQPCILPLW